MRFWISPDLHRIEIYDGDNHSMAVVGDPAAYGLDPASVSDYMRALEDEESDFEFDYNAVIVLAEMAGWVRTSRDVDFGGGEVAVSASDVRRARKAIRSLLEDGHLFPGGIKLEIDRIEGNSVLSEYRVLDSEAVDLFAEAGRLPMAKRYTTRIEPESLEFVRAALDARRSATSSFQHA
ncbi:hypothetical protein G6L37_34540 [Agrobacterium rubi]|nr:hypothetical protein [Agrobacterium rubi]NTF23686.1 hypothetical protein [Agrobacterium rubi]